MKPATFLAAATACGVAGYAFARRWFAAAATVEQAPLPYLPPRESAREVEQRNLDEAWTRIVQQINNDAADRAMPESRAESKANHPSNWKRGAGK